MRFPWLPNDDESYWARILAPMAGPSRGTYFLPEVEDQCLVVFEHGDVSRPIIVGFLWSSQQKPPQRNDDGKNNLRVIKSKSGHRVILDDTAGSERVIVVDSTRKNKIVLDSGKDELVIESAGDIELLASSGTVKLHGKTVKMTATGTLGGQGTTLDVSGQSMNVSATGPLEIKGGVIMLNPGGGSAGSLPPSSVSAGSAESVSPRDQVREQGAAAGAAGARRAAAPEPARTRPTSTCRRPATRTCRRSSRRPPPPARSRRACRSRSARWSTAPRRRRSRCSTPTPERSSPAASRRWSAGPRRRCGPARSLPPAPTPARSP